MFFLSINNNKGNRMSFTDKLKKRIKETKKTLSTAIADEDKQQERISICNSCEFLNVMRQCKKCGCFVDAKTRLNESACPLRKW